MIRENLELTSLECVAALQKLGFAITTVTDQHVALQREARIVVVPRHQMLQESVLRLVASRASIDVEELVKVARPPGRAKSGEHALMTVGHTAKTAKAARRS